MTMESSFRPSSFKTYKWTYRWYVPGYDDDIYWDSITLEWLKPGTPSQEAILAAIKSENNFKEEDMVNIKIAGMPEVEELR